MLGSRRVRSPGGLLRDTKVGLPLIRFFLFFALIQVLLFTAELTPPAQQHVVIPFTEGVARTSAWIVTFFDSQVVATGNVLRHTGNGFAVAIEAGCNGIEATIVLLAALLSFPATWRYRFLGIGAGFAAIQLLNLLRIITLFYLGQWSKDVFEWAHLYVWQALIMLDVLVVFLVWLRYLPGSKPKHEDVPVGA